jgi:hypothetical protein
MIAYIASAVPVLGTVHEIEPIAVWCGALPKIGICDGAPRQNAPRVNLVAVNDRFEDPVRNGLLAAMCHTCNRHVPCLQLPLHVRRSALPTHRVITALHDEDVLFVLLQGGPGNIGVDRGTPVRLSVMVTVDQG